MDDAVQFRYRSAGTDLVGWTCGRGRPLVMLHGSGLATHAMFRTLGEELSSSFQIITCDIRGFGKSVSRDAAAHTWAQYTTDVVALLDHLSLPQAVLCGYSFGAGIAVSTALRQPDRVFGLVLAAPGYAGTEIGQTEPQRAVWAAGRSFFALARQVGLECALLGTAATDPQQDAVRREVACHDELSFLAAHEGELATAQPFPRLSALQSISVPTLVLAGTDDAHDPQIATWYAEQLPIVTAEKMVDSSPASWAPPIRTFIDGTAAHPRRPRGSHGVR